MAYDSENDIIIGSRDTGEWFSVGEKAVKTSERIVTVKTNPSCSCLLIGGDSSVWRRRVIVMSS